MEFTVCIHTQKKESSKRFPDDKKSVAMNAFKRTQIRSLTHTPSLSHSTQHTTAKEAPQHTKSITRTVDTDTEKQDTDRDTNRDRDRQTDNQTEERQIEAQTLKCALETTNWNQMSKTCNGARTQGNPLQFRKQEAHRRLWANFRPTIHGLSSRENTYTHLSRQFVKDKKKKPKYIIGKEDNTKHETK